MEQKDDDNLYYLYVVKNNKAPEKGGSFNNVYKSKIKIKNMILESISSEKEEDFIKFIQENIDPSFKKVGAIILGKEEIINGTLTFKRESKENYNEVAKNEQILALQKLLKEKEEKRDNIINEYTKISEEIESIKLAISETMKQPNQEKEEGFQKKYQINRNK